ncbi:MAG: nucleotidyl transferase AbiEii/AbiGii toxin family protein [Anaerolineae bacterium]|nr:nucleotidyl transferase AbiEii/AbiGii toxin family protein [Anaerolineae bacterium]
MYVEGISAKVQASLELVGQTPLAAQFYLAGGTAIALHLGHRRSYDLDFFSPAPFDKGAPRRFLGPLGRLIVEQEGEGTFLGALNDVRISFSIYPYRLLTPPALFGAVRIAALEDLAVMKLDAIASRGKKRDFIDLYFLCQDFLTLREMLPLVGRKYEGVEYNFTHLLKSLIYFEDAEADPMPEMLKPVSWPDVRRFFEREAQALIRRL